MMGEQVKRFLSMLFEGLVASAMRLARAAAIRAELESYTALFEEAETLEQRGQTRLAQHLRREVDGILDSSSFPGAGPALNGDDQVPFALESSSGAGAGPLPLEQRRANEAEGKGSAPRRRRGRPRVSESETTATTMKNGEPRAEADASPELPQPLELMSEFEERVAKNEEATVEQTQPRAPREMSSDSTEPL